jgi:hypothetical protein
MTAYVQSFDKMTEDEKFAIISALGPRNRGDEDLLDKVMAGADEGVYTIQMVVNGVEVHAHDFMHRYLDAIEEIAKRKAEEMLREKFQEMTQAFDPIKDMLDAAEKSLAEQFGIERDSWGDY